MRTWIAALAMAALFGMSRGAFAAEPPSGSGSYEDFVALFLEFEDWREDDALIEDEEGGLAVADYSDDAVAARIDAVDGYLEGMAEMNVAAWERGRQAEYLAVRARIDQHNFWLRASRPFERDPGFYVDPLLWITFAELPAEGEALERLRARLEAVPALLDAARVNLDAAAADYADLALRNLTTADGVGHGHPYRETPPAGVIGWYEDMLARAEARQPALARDIETALAAIRDFRDWLAARRPEMTAPAGVGEARFDWYLEHVKLMPWTAQEIVALGERELDRLSAFHALERHRNRDLPELEPAGSAEEYRRRIAEADAEIRRFLEVGHHHRPR